MHNAVQDLALLVPQPRPVRFVDQYALRHVEKLPEQAIVQKLSRIASGLQAASILLESGMFQEQAALQRMIDEIGEDLFFLSTCLLDDQVTELHQRYLDIFFQEEFSSVTGKPLDEPKPMIPRKAIRAHVANNGADDPSGHIKASKTVHRIDSGYIHATSPHIMDSCLGNPPTFRTRGMLGTHRETEYCWYLKNYFYRSSQTFALCAHALKSPRLAAEMRELSRLLHIELESHVW